MRGHVTKRGDAWRVHVFLGLDEQTGKKRYLTRTVRGTKREAETVCAQLVSGAARGEHGETAAGTMADLLDRWLEHLAQDASPSTIASYRVYLRNHILPALGPKKVDRLRPADLDRFYAQLRRRLSPASVLKVHTILRAALGQAVKWRMLGDNPAAHATPPRAPRPPIQPPTPEQVAVLLAAADADDPELGLFLRLAAVTGARRGELCALRWSDLDLAEGEVVIARSIVHGDGQVYEKGTKTNRARRVALDDATAEALRVQRRRAEERAQACGHRLGDDVFLFAQDVAGLTSWRPDSGATDRFGKLRHKVGLDHVRLHDLRHFVATRLLDAGLSVRAVSERLGHASTTTTLNIYAHAVPATDRRAAAVMGDLLQRH